jgi:hypothetical protein
LSQRRVPFFGVAALSFLQIHGEHRMAAKKRKRAGAAKRKAAPSRKSTSRARKAAKQPAKKSAKAARKSVKAVAKKTPAKKTSARKTKTKTKGEGDYAASRAFLKDQAGFVEKNKGRIPAMGKEAEKALEGPEGASLRDAEATAAARSRDTL